MKRKSQSSLEFLITYSWAIIIIVGVVSALFFMGIQNPERFVSEQCFFEDSFHCLEHSFIAEDNSLLFIVDNIVGMPLDITRINFESERTDCEFDSITVSNSSFEDLNGLPIQIPHSGRLFVNASCSPATELLAGSTLAVQVDIIHKVAREGFFQKSSRGKIVGKT